MKIAMRILTGNILSLTFFNNIFYKNKSGYICVDIINTLDI